MIATIPETFSAWGQTIVCLDETSQTWEMELDRAILREKEPPKIGISKPIAEFMIKRKGTLIIKIKEPGAQKSVFFDPTFRKATKMKVPSKIGAKPMVFYLQKL